MSELVLCHVCGEVAKYRGQQLCAKHYQRLKAHGDFETHERERQVCTVVGCKEWVKAYGYCTKHWRRIQKHGDHEDRKWSRRGSDRCVVPGCGAAHRSMGLCDTHYGREQKYGHPVWRTLGSQKVHEDRPWTPDSVRDARRLRLTEQTILTDEGRSPHTDRGDDVTDELTTELPARICTDCDKTVVPIVCGERMGDTLCQDLICPECAETLEIRAS